MKNKFFFFWCRNFEGLLPSLYRERKKNLYCNVGIVLHETGERAVEIVLQDGCFGLELYCNTIDVLQAERLGWLAVSQYSRSILWLGKGLLGESRYKNCIVIEAVGGLGVGLGCWACRVLDERAQGAGRHGAGRAGGRLAGGRAGARLGARTAGSGAQGARGVRSKGAAGARPGRWARMLALGCALGALGPFSIRFDSVFFLSQLLDIVREPGS